MHVVNLIIVVVVQHMAIHVKHVVVAITMKVYVETNSIIRSNSQRNKPLQNKYKPKDQSVDVQESSKEDYFCYIVNVKHRKTLP